MTKPTKRNYHEIGEIQCLVKRSRGIPFDLGQQTFTDPLNPPPKATVTVDLIDRIATRLILKDHQFCGPTGVVSR